MENLLRVFLQLNGHIRIYVLRILISIFDFNFLQIFIDLNTDNMNATKIHRQTSC